MIRFDILQSPLGELLALSDGESLTGLYLNDRPHAPQRRTEWRRDRSVFQNLEAELAAYFAGELRDFELPVRARGTSFQERVWRALRTIPYGETRSYREIAQAIGSPRAVRAVGAANARNPISLILPCHRVVATNGALTGYAGGIERKRWLLAHEARNAARLGGEPRCSAETRAETEREAGLRAEAGSGTEAGRGTDDAGGDRGEARPEPRRDVA